MADAFNSEIRDLCKWFMGNLDAVGKFRAASAVEPKYLHIAEYNPYYIENIEEPEKLDEILKKLGDITPPRKKSIFRRSKDKGSVRVVEKLLFKGMPKIGKTRAVYEKIIKRLDKFVVFFPSPTELGKFKRSEVRPGATIRGMNLVLFLDDIDKYIVTPGIDLRDFISHLEDACHRLLVVATLRTGVEDTDKVMQDRQAREMIRHDFQEIGFKAISNDEAGKLAAAIGKDKHAFDGTTPGSVVLGLEEMRLRLGQMSKNERAVCNTLKLLSFALITEPERDIAKAVSDTVFNTNFSTEPLEWSDCIKKLTDNSLVVEAEDSLRAPHRDFYKHVYAPGYTPERNDLEKLEACLTDKDDAGGLFYLGTSFATLSGDYKKAISCYDKALRIDKNNAEAWHNRGCSLAELGRHEDAIKSYDKALEVDPNMSEAWYNKGRSLAKLGRHEDAIKSSDKALKIDKNDAKAWYNRGYSLAKLDRHEEAIESYDKALEIDKNDVEAWYNRGLSLYELDRHEEAIASCDKALEIDPRLVLAWYNRGNSLFRLRRREEAIASYDKAIEIDPRYALAWYNKGLLLHEMGKIQEAKEHIKKAIKIDPSLDEPPFIKE
ncbi:MAG: tetratricopeptide repeat protein [Candidatus Brocadiales bacterium]|nr:tetratricopeptide repeat protein [Candidatus Bathyanammoxibius sp.]